MSPSVRIHPARLVDALMPPRLADHDAVRASRLVVKVALITLSVSLLMEVVYFAQHARQIALITAISVTLQVLGLALHRITGSHRVGGHVHVLALWALFFGIAALSGGIDSPNLVANIFVVVLAPLLLGRRHGLFWLGAVALTYFGQFFLASHGLVQQTLSAADIPATRLTELTVTSITTGVTAYVFAKGEERMRGEIAREKHALEIVNGDLRIILDNAGQGFLSLDTAGRLIGERSAVIDGWFANGQVGRHFWDLLRPLEPAVAERFENEWSQVEAGILPLEVCLEQLPRDVRAGELSLRLEYRAVLATGRDVEKFVVIISDISAEVARKEAEVRQRDLLSAFERILRDPDGFAIFLRSANRDVRAVGARELEGGELKRCLHTLKGNSAMMGLSALARSCHELEDELVERGALGEPAITALEREFSAIEVRLAPFVRSNVTDITLRVEEYERFLRALAARKSHEELLRLARSWSDRPVDRHLARLSEYAEQLSRRLGKGELSLGLSGGELRMSDRFAGFWIEAVHVVKNAVDHGLEEPEERAQLGKGPACLSIRVSGTDGRVEVEIGDDGRGIDWDKIRELALARGLPASTERDLFAALFADGLSTSAEVTDISGRGVGMSSVGGLCQTLGIGIEVRSSAGAGTTFRFVFPEAATTAVDARPVAISA